MTTLAVRAVVIVMLLSACADASVMSGPINYPANGHNYYLLSSQTWTASESEAVTLGGHLATVDDAAEQNFIWTTFNFPGRNLWIGLREVGVEGNYQWVSGAPLSYTNWYAGEPNNANGTEAYVHMLTENGGYNGKWNDAPDDGLAGFFNPTYGVVEVVPEPGSLCLMLIGVAHALRRRRWNR